MYLNRGRHLLSPIVLVPVPLPLPVPVLDTASVITRPPIFQKILTYKKKETKRMVDIVALMGHATKLNTLALKWRDRKGEVLQFPVIFTVIDWFISSKFNTYWLQSGTSTPDDSTEGKPDSQVEVNSLCAHFDQKSNLQVVRYPPITGSVEERCREALAHISKVVFLPGKFLFL